MLSPDVENILEIQKKRTVRDEQLKLKMLSIIKEKINNYAKFGQKNCIYTVPNFLVGEIPYKIESMTKYIIKKLKSEGLYIIKLSDQYIYISWDIKDITKAMEEKKNKINKDIDDLNNYSAFVNNSKKY